MHHPRHSFVIRSLRIAAFLFCLKRVLIALAIPVLIVSLFKADSRATLASLATLGGIIPLSLAQWMFASAGKCPICMMPVLSLSGCAIHSRTRRVLGSHRLRVALSILLKGSFHCPYCHEPTMLRLKPVPTVRRR
jgi:hypothetical protein